VGGCGTPASEPGLSTRQCGQRGRGINHIHMTWQTDRHGIARGKLSTRGSVDAQLSTETVHEPVDNR
jgi:hypothetical protein